MDDTPTEFGQQVERVEMARLAGKMLGSIDYLRKVCEVRRYEGATYTALADNLANLVWARERIVDLARTLPAGPLETFGHEHPLVNDDVDGPYCGYRNEDDVRVPCPVHDLALHWDAWELLGTRHKRPESARREESHG